MPVIRLKCLYCKKNQVESWIEEVCLLCKNKKFQYPKSVKLEMKDGDYKWRQYGICCVGKPIIKKTTFPKINLLNNNNNNNTHTHLSDTNQHVCVNPFMDDYYPPILHQYVKLNH